MLLRREAPVRTSHSNAVTAPAVSASCSPASLSRSTASCRRRSANSAASTKAQSDTATMPACDPRMRSAGAMPGSPNRPIPKVVVHTMVRATMNAAAAANTGRHRAASHSSTGNSSATEITGAQVASGRATTSAPITASNASAVLPSTSSA